MIQNLAFLVCILQNNVGDDANKTWPKKGTKYIYYWKKDHYLK